MPDQTDSSTAPKSIDNADKSMDDIMALCKRRGFIYQASEIYGGINGFWDYGPLGAQLKKNLRDAWWEDVIMMGCSGATGPDGKPVEIVPLDTCIIQNPKVWEASGHIGGFNDPMVDDKETKQRFRADHLVGLFVIPEDHPDLRFGVNDGLYAALLKAIAEGSLLPRTTFVGSTADAHRALLDMSSNKSESKRRGLSPKKTEMKSLLNLSQAVAVEVEDHRIKKHCVGLLCPVPESMLKDQSSLVPSPFTDKPGNLTAPRAFNLMFPTVVGATGDVEDDKAYLRPETAQGIFIHFKNVVDTTRVKLPFGIANVGKSFRNEVTPRNFTFRSREFEQMECEFFCHSDDAKAWYQFWRDSRMAWWESIGLAGANLRLREHDQDELAHYAKDGAGTADVEYKYPFTAPDYGELEGIAHRADFDLKQHQEHSKVKLEYFDTTRGELAPNGQPKGERYLPHCIEPAAGLDRGVLALICEAYTPDPDRPSKLFMRFHPRIAPIKAAVFPLVAKGGMPEVATELHRTLRKRFGKYGLIEYDAKQSVGKRYARMDEAGCPYCFTIDGETVEDGPNKNTVTVRDRDTAEQTRLPIEQVPGFLAEKLGLSCHP
ncbi:MAG: glycine--tRNA ligase [Phycisphaerales bacterium JB065]